MGVLLNADSNLSSVLRLICQRIYLPEMMVTKWTRSVSTACSLVILRVRLVSREKSGQEANEWRIHTVHLEMSNENEEENF